MASIFLKMIDLMRRVAVTQITIINGIVVIVTQGITFSLYITKIFD